MLENQIPVDKLRDLYVKGNLRQRYDIAAQVAGDPDTGPAKLVAAVAALEGFARAVAVKHLVDEGVPPDEAYAGLKREKPIDLVETHVLPALGTSANEAFEREKWELLPEAVKFRNLLVHEATYLHGGTCRELVSATLHVFEKIAELSGVKP